jgi:hypothetical protein
MPRFVVRTTEGFERLARSHGKRHPEFAARLEEALEVLREDPYNRSRAHAIKKLVGVERGEGQYRVRIRRWRFRYDVHGREVVLLSCGLRREDTYR